MRIRPDRAGNLSDADSLSGALDPAYGAPELGVPQRQLQAKRHRLCVHAVGAPDHRRVAMLPRPVRDRLKELTEVVQDQSARLAHLERERRVQDVV